MRIPFTHEQFLNLFGEYNREMWPVELVLWVTTVGILWLALRRQHRSSGRWICVLLAFHWAWSGIVYHLVYFRTINPAAALFGLLFVIEAALFTWLGFRKGAAEISIDSSGWRVVALVLVAYSLAYPAINLISSMAWPRLPLFAVPCPTTILTAGLLMHVEPRTAWRLALIPLVWSAIGGSAAFVLGVAADFGLPIGGAALLAYLLLRPNRVMTANP